MNKKNILWMQVSKDEYELPLAVADTASALAKICGVTENAIKSGVCHREKGRRNGCFVKVYLDGYDDSEQEVRTGRN